MGAFGDPRVPDMKHAADILLGARFQLDLYVNYRPVRCLDDRLCPLKGFAARDVDFVVFRENTEGSYVGAGRQLQEGNAGRGRRPGGRLDAQGRRADHPLRVRVRAGARAQAGRDVRQVQRDALRRRPLAADVLRRSAQEYPGHRGVAPLRRRALHADRPGSAAVRRDRDEQHVRRHRDGPRRGAAGRPRHGRLRQHPPGPRLDVRAGPRLGARSTPAPARRIPSARS